MFKWFVRNLDLDDLRWCVMTLLVASFWFASAEVAASAFTGCSGSHRSDTMPARVDAVSDARTGLDSSV